MIFVSIEVNLPEVLMQAIHAEIDRGRFGSLSEFFITAVHLLATQLERDGDVTPEISKVSETPLSKYLDALKVHESTVGGS